MNDFNKPVRPVKREESDEINIESITDKLKESEDLLSDNKKPNNKKNSLLTYVSLMKRFFNFFSTRKEDSSLLYETKLLSHLSHLKDLLIKIREENPTQNPTFAKNFAQTWNKICEENKISPSQKLSQLILALDTFPNKDEHSLNFYLIRYSGEEWFPLPFFDLLKQLHSEYALTKKTSDLDRWISLISEILTENTKN